MLVVDRLIETYLRRLEDLLPKSPSLDYSPSVASSDRLQRLLEFAELPNPLRGCTPRQAAAICLTVGGRASTPYREFFGSGLGSVDAASTRPLTAQEIAGLIGCSVRTYYRELSAARKAVEMEID